MMDQRFDDHFDDRDAMVAAFERHNDAVREGVPAGRLLEWTVTDGWEPICTRLGVAVPDSPSRGPTPPRNGGPWWACRRSPPPDPTTAAADPSDHDSGLA